MATSTTSGLLLSQTKYIVDLLKRHSMTDCKPCSTLVFVSRQLFSLAGELLYDAIEYRQLVGSLQYLTFTRPDISFVVHHIVQFMSAPHSPHLVAAKRILRYLKSTLAPLLFVVSLILIGLVVLIPVVQPLCAKKQSTVSRSSAEAKYRSLAHVCVYTTWISHLLHELELPPSVPTLLLCDNLSTTYMASNSVFHARTKHIELDYHFIRERIISGSHRVQFVSFSDQLANILTKGFSTHRFQLIRSNIISSTSSDLRGSVYCQQ
ncbi:Far-red impaired responsive family protein [Prunus dulcis]|uniref:Far-red impaired responsive family protein n=1 Tax=Prunus dulcis TaxID=3755 RepID=A0A4Y1QLE2_PRUDU|nr:Far-red impaired responsive family protein [Prunus dulcis]